MIDHIDGAAHLRAADFITAVVEHVGNPTLLVSKAPLRSKLETAAAIVRERLAHEVEELLRKC